MRHKPDASLIHTWRIRVRHANFRCPAVTTLARWRLHDGISLIFGSCRYSTVNHLNLTCCCRKLSFQLLFLREQSWCLVGRENVLLTKVGQQFFCVGVILTSNMTGVDRKDQVLATFPVMRKSVIGYKIFLYLLDMILQCVCRAQENGWLHPTLRRASTTVRRKSSGNLQQRLWPGNRESKKRYIHQTS